MSITDLTSIEDHERFRAELASIRPDGRRKWIYARQPRGRYTRWRTILSVFLVGFLLLAPYVKINGHQFILLNIIDREFVLFGMPFWPNDFYLVALLFLTGIVTFVVATASIGRIWCGWLCPQTVFMEMIFRKIEWLIDGSPVEQAKRHAGRWSASRLARTVVKVIVFFLLSFIIANTFLSYVISSDVLLRYIWDGPQAHWELFAGLLFFSFVFFMVFYRFREQACLIACPYGRYMSALVDEKTVTVTYDHRRGEKRAKWSREDVTAQRQSQIAGAPFHRSASSGDCLDCHQCVTVCPTGIDIRNGIQLECIACTACMDACDEVMEKVGLEKGLIRYASLAAVTTGETVSFLSRRVVAYGLVWLLLVGTVVTIFLMRSPVDVTILRQEGTTWVTTKEGLVNFYRLQVINKSAEDRDFHIRIVHPKGFTLQPIILPTHLVSGQLVKGRFMITRTKHDEQAEGEHSSNHAGQEKSSSDRILLEVRSAGHVEQFTTSFVGP